MIKKLRDFLIITLTFTIFLNTFSFASQEPEIVAQTAILVETSSGKILYEKSSHNKMYPASMTKLLTALIVLEHFQPDELITVGNEINSVSWDSSKAGVVRGETLTVENLLRGLIIPSGNDVANVLASAVAKRIRNNQDLSYNECEVIFTDLMNKKAQELGANESHFSNAHGYHDEDHYTTAYDMSLIARATLQNEEIKKIASEKSFSGNGAGEEYRNDRSITTRNHNWTSHNLLITNGTENYPYATGLKTGFTDEAGDCIAASAQKDDISLVAVVMNSEDPNRWADSRTLFEYGFNNFKTIEIQKNGDIVDTVQLTKNNRLNGDTLDIIVKEDISEFMNIEQVSTIEKSIIYNDNLIAQNKDDSDKTIKLIAPISKDSEVGTIQYLVGDNVVKETKLYAANDVEKSTMLSTIKYFFKTLFSKIFTPKNLITTAIVIGIIILLLIIITKFKNRNKRRIPHSKYKFKKR